MHGTAILAVVDERITGIAIDEEQVEQIDVAAVGHLDDSRQPFPVEPRAGSTAAQREVEAIDFEGRPAESKVGAFWQLQDKWRLAHGGS